MIKCFIGQVENIRPQKCKNDYAFPIKKEAQFRKFEKKFHVPVERKDELIGHPLMVEVKSAFGTNFWGDIKAFPKAK